jgi:hypothetical protein
MEARVVAGTVTAGRRQPAISTVLEVVEVHHLAHRSHGVM